MTIQFEDLTNIHIYRFDCSSGPIKVCPVAGLLSHADETAYTLDTYPGHYLDTSDIFHQFFDVFPINIRLFQPSLVYFQLLNI
jgi:hypothetical protein